MADRVNFDKWVYDMAQEDLSFCKDDDLLIIEKDVDSYVNQMLNYYFNELDLFVFDEGGSGTIYVDDRVEAEARFFDVYKKAVFEWIERMRK